jgi:hypothetical protein
LTTGCCLMAVTIKTVFSAANSKHDMTWYSEMSWAKPV